MGISLQLAANTGYDVRKLPVTRIGSSTQYLNNRMEQDHCGIKQRYYPMRGFGSFKAASRFCRAFDKLRQFERYRRVRAETGSLAERRQHFTEGTVALQAMLLGA